MKAAVYRAVRDVRVEEVAEPRPGPGEVKVRVKYCGICGSDLHEYQHGLFPRSFFGHEACGEVVEAGRRVEDFKPGDRVISFHPGAFAEYLVCPRERLLKIPPAMSWERAAVVEPLGVAACSIERGGILPGSAVLVAGAGPVGLMTVLGLRAAGAATIFVTEVAPLRRKKAEEMGASLTCDPRETKVSPWIKENTSGKGADAAFESVGVEAALKDCLASVRFQGKVIVQGIFTGRVPIHMLGFVTRETTLIGVNSANPALALSWIREKALRPEGMVTRILPLERVSEGFAALSREIKEEIKILVEP